MTAASLASVPAAATDGSPAAPVTGPAHVIRATVVTPPAWRRIEPYIAALPQASRDRMASAYDEAARSAVYLGVAATRPDFADAAFFTDMRERVVLKGMDALARARTDLDADERAVARADADGRQAAMAVRKAEAAAPRERICATIRAKHGRHGTSCRSAIAATPAVAVARDALVTVQQARNAALRQAASDRDLIAGIEAEPARAAALGRLFTAGKTVAQSFYLSLAMRTRPDEAVAEAKLAARSGVNYAFDLADARAAAVLDATAAAFTQKWLEFYALYKPNDGNVLPVATGNTKFFDMSPRDIVRLTTVCKSEATREMKDVGLAACDAVILNRKATGEFGARPWENAGQFESIKRYGGIDRMPRPTAADIAVTMQVVRRDVPDPTFGGALFFQNTCIDRQRGTDFGQAAYMTGTIGDRTKCNVHDFYNGYGKRQIAVPDYQVVMRFSEPVIAPGAPLHSRHQLASVQVVRGQVRPDHVRHHRWAAGRARYHRYAMI